MYFFLKGFTIFIYKKKPSTPTCQSYQHIAAYTYDLNGKTVTNYSYFPLTCRLSTINAYTVPGGVNIIYKLYDYNKSGDITGLHDLKNNIDYIYAYDHLHRLISEESSGTGASTGATVEVIDFTYTQESGKPVHAPVQTTLNGAPTQYGYTATGTRLSKQDGLNTTLYEVNYDNQIKKITAGGVVTNFFYDADGKRIRKTQGSSSTLYFGKDFEITNNAPTLYAFAGNLRIAKMTAAGTEYYHKDHQGSTNAVSDENGTVVDTAEYLPYGPDRSVNALLNHSAYKYTDQEQDSGTGLYNYDARLYDPVLGQFVMADTIVPDPFNPQSLNRYAYCLNNPIRYTDPTGHWSFMGDGVDDTPNSDGSYGAWKDPSHSSGNGGGGYDWGSDGNYGLSKAEVIGDRLRFDYYNTVPPSLINEGMKAIENINPTSIENNLEYGGYIVLNPDKTFSYQGPKEGTAKRLAMPPKPLNAAADYHTHGAEDPDFENEDFSPKDKDDNDKNGLPGFLGTPSGAKKMYNPKTKKVTILKQD